MSSRRPAPPETQSTTALQGSDSGARRIGAATTVMVLTVLPAFSLGALGPLIAENFGGDSRVIGQAYALFFLMAGGSAPLWGKLVDRAVVAVDGRVLLGVAAVSTVVMAAAQLKWHLLAAAVLGGLSYGGGNPTTNVLLSDVDKRWRGVGLGTKQAGVPAASMLAGLLVPLIGVRFGWRMTLLTVGAAALAAAAALRSRRQRSADHLEATRALPPLAETGRKIRLALTIYAFTLSFSTSVFNTYLVFYLVEDIGLTAANAGLAFAGGGAFGILARVGLARIGDRLEARSTYTLLGALALGGALAALLLIGGGVGVRGWPVAIALYGSCLFGWGGVLAVALVRATPGRTGQTTGIVYGGFYAGLAAGPFVVGSLIIPYVGFSVGWAACGVASLAAAAVAYRARWQMRAAPDASRIRGPRSSRS